MALVNLYSFILMAKAVLPAMKRRTEKSCIINIASGAALMPKPMNCIYACSKIGAKNFSEALCKELAST
jgi:short-subunit dehydrogenase